MGGEGGTIGDAKCSIFIPYKIRSGPRTALPARTPSHPPSLRFPLKPYQTYSLNYGYHDSNLLLAWCSWILSRFASTNPGSALRDLSELVASRSLGASSLETLFSIHPRNPESTSQSFNVSGFFFSLILLPSVILLSALFIFRRR